MNFIEGACTQIVSPPKFKYSSMDLGIPSPTQAQYCYHMDDDMTSKFKTNFPII